MSRYLPLAVHDETATPTSPKPTTKVESLTLLAPVDLTIDTHKWVVAPTVMNTNTHTPTDSVTHLQSDPLTY